MSRECARSKASALVITLLVAAAVAALAATEARAERPRVYAIIGARVIVAPGQVIEDGTIVLRDGLIEAVGKDVKVPPDAVTVDGKGKTVHAGFIDACSEVGLRKNEGAPGSGSGSPGSVPGGRPAAPPPPPGAVHPIARIHPERRVLDMLDPADRDLEKHRGMGFTAVLTVPQEGIFRGTSALITLRDGPVGGSVVRAEVAQHVAFERGGFGQGYPSSLMGAIAAIRQGFEDARRHDVWQARYDASPQGMKRPDVLSAYAPLARAASGKIPVIFDADTPSNVLRALGLAREYGLDAIVIGSGADYEVLDPIKASGRPMIISMAFPEKPDLDDADEALEVETLALERYLGARANPARLAAAGVPLAIGTCRLKNLADFPGNLRKAIDEGLTADAALAALTTTPARLFGVERSLGTLEAGKSADVVVEDGAVFGEKTKAVRVYVDGTEYTVEEKKTKGDPNAKVDPRGTWSVTFTIGGRPVSRTWTIGESEGAYEGTAETREGTVSFSSIKLAGNEMTVVIPSPRGGSQEITVIVTGESFEGSGEFPSGPSFTVKGTRTSGPPGKTPGDEHQPYSCMSDEGGDL
jgi:imidazolonepropionase-like amidohydrolase